MIFIVFIIGVFSQSEKGLGENIIDELKNREMKYKEMKKKIQGGMEEYRINHIIREIERKKTATIIYKRLEERMRNTRQKIEEMRKEVEGYKVCSNQEEQERLKNMKDTLFRERSKIRRMEEESKELINSIKEPSYV